MSADRRLALQNAAQCTNGRNDGLRYSILRGGNGSLGRFSQSLKVAYQRACCAKYLDELVYQFVVKQILVWQVFATSQAEHL